MTLLLRWINRIEEAVIGLLLVSITLLVFVEVVMRFGFNTGISWVQEATLLMSAWFVLFGISYGLKVGAHINVDAVVRLLPEQGQRIAAVIAISLGLVYCGLFIYGSWIYLAKMKRLASPGGHSGADLAGAQHPDHRFGDAGAASAAVDVGGHPGPGAGLPARA